MLSARTGLYPQSGAESLIQIKRAWLPRTLVGTAALVATGTSACRSPSELEDRSSQNAPQSGLNQKSPEFVLVDRPPPQTPSATARADDAQTPTGSLSLPSPDDLGHLVILTDTFGGKLSLPEDLNAALAQQTESLPSPGQCALFTALDSGAPHGTQSGAPSLSFRIALPQAPSGGETLAATAFAPRPVVLMSPFSKDTAPRPVGWALPDSSGRFSCKGMASPPNLSFDDDTMLTRLEAPASSSPEQVYVLPQKATLVVNTGATKDTPLLLRVAFSEAGLRRWPDQPEAQERPQGSNPDQQPSFSPPPSLGKGWAWRQINQSPSTGLRVHSYYRPTFLVRRASLKLELTPGSYILAFIDPQTHNLCLIERRLLPGQIEEASCPPAPATNSGSDSVDQLLWPRSLQAHQTRESFFDLVKLREASLPMAELTRRDDALFVGKDPRQISQSRQAYRSDVTPLWSTTEDPIFLEGSYAVVAGPVPSAESSVRAYLAGTELPALALSGWLPGLLSTAHDSKSSPLLMQTRLMSNVSKMPNADSLLTLVTNGVTLNWKTIEPRSSLAVAPPDGIFAVTVRIPPLNLTEYIETHINGRLWSRRVINRGNPKKTLDVALEERIGQNKDFILSLYAWGRGYLPEFIFGQPHLRPLALLSRVCFDVNKNGICDQH